MAAEPALAARLAEAAFSAAASPGQSAVEPLEFFSCRFSGRLAAEGQPPLAQPDITPLSARLAGWLSARLAAAFSGQYFLVSQLSRRIFSTEPAGHFSIVFRFLAAS